MKSTHEVFVRSNCHKISQLFILIQKKNMFRPMATVILIEMQLKHLHLW